MRLSPKSNRSFKASRPTPAPAAWLGRNKSKIGIAAAVGAVASLAVVYVVGAVRSYNNPDITRRSALGWPATAAKARVERFRSGVAAAPHN